MSNKGRVWSVDPEGAVYRWTNNTWVEIARNGTAKQISVGESGVWLVDRDGAIHYRTQTYGDVDTAGSEVSR